jgi:hypothetical protein
MNPAWKRVIYHANRQRKPEKQNQKEDKENETTLNVGTTGTIWHEWY